MATSLNSIPELSVVMPCYNEAVGLESVLLNWLHELRDKVGNFEILVINDGSTDGSGRILDRIRRENKELRVFHQLKVGHGRAIRRGYELSRGKYVAQVDPNGCYETSDFFRLWQLRSSFGLVLGHRTHRIDSLARRGVSRLSRQTIQWLFKVQMADPDVPFRVMESGLLKSLLACIPKNQEGTNLALSVLFMRLGDQVVAEVPIPFRFRSYGNSKTGLFSSLVATSSIVGELLNLKWATTLSPMNTLHQVTKTS